MVGSLQHLWRTIINANTKAKAAREWSNKLIDCSAALLGAYHCDATALGHFAPKQYRGAPEHRIFEG
jgi:hypothetical protein